MPRHLPALATISSIAAAVALAGMLSRASGAPTPPSRWKSPLVEPFTVSPACSRDARRHAACVVVQEFFRAVNSRRFTASCGLLGAKLHKETYGLPCPRFIEVGVPEPMPWGIVGARTSDNGVIVLVALGQDELGHVRMRRHQAFVGVEGGRLRILWTKIVA